MLLFKDELKTEEKTLREQIIFLREKSKDYPKGTLNIGHSNGSVQYYHHLSDPLASDQEQTRSRVRYIRKKDKEFAIKLAQKDYEESILEILECRHKTIRKVLSIYENTDLVSPYEECCIDRKNLIEPLYETDDEYAASWQSVPYSHKKFAEGTVEIFTARGERVRSKSEKIIADTFERYGISYRYEFPIELPGEGLFHPDFTILNKRTRKEYYWEHLGMMDREEYAVNAIRRLDLLQMHGILPGKNLLITSETASRPLNVVTVDRLIQEFLL